MEGEATLDWSSLGRLTSELQTKQGVGHEATGVKNILSRRNSQCQIPGAESALERQDREKISVPGVW